MIMIGIIPILCCLEAFESIAAVAVPLWSADSKCAPPGLLLAIVDQTYEMPIYKCHLAINQPSCLLFNVVNKVGITIGCQ